eukprot:gene9663-17422_t
MTKLESCEGKYGLVEIEKSSSGGDLLEESQKEDRVSRRFCSQHLREKRKEKISSFKDDGWLNVQEQARPWSTINVDSADSKYAFTKVFEKITETCAFGKAHTACRTSFRTKLESCEGKYGLVEIENSSIGGDLLEESQKEDRVSRRFCSQHLREKRKEKISSFKDDGWLNVQEQARPWSTINVDSADSKYAFTKVFEKITETCAFGKAHTACRTSFRTKLESCEGKYGLVEIENSSIGGDLLEESQKEDRVSRRFCSQHLREKRFAINEQRRQKQIDDDLEDIQNDVMSEILGKIRTKILLEKQAFLLSNLLRDVMNLSDEKGIDSPVNNTAALKKKLVGVFSERLGFYSSGRQVIIYSSDVNPLEYATATLKGHGLRDEDIIKACAAMIRRKMEARVENEWSWPCNPNELIEQFDRGLLQDIYNMIYATVDKNYKINQYGYAMTRSKPMATKVWSLASDWEVLLSPKQKNVKQVIAEMTLHRFTASKQSVVILHKLGNCISYADIRLQNDAWARMVSASGRVSNEMAKGISTHATIDNNDGSQDTATGSGTRHDTNCTLFQQVLPGENPAPSVSYETSLNIAPDVDELEEIGKCEIGQRIPPKLFIDHVDNTDDDLLTYCLKRNVVWAMLDGLPGRTEDDNTIGSWTAFNKIMTDVEVQKSLVEYLPVIPQPPEYPVCKNFLDKLLRLMKELDIGHIYAHADEQVYARLAHILWKYPDTYKNVIILMGGFHQSRVKQQMIHKRHACKGYKSWWTDAGVIAMATVDKAAEGGHYYRNMRLHKESFYALVQFRVTAKQSESLTAKYTDIDAGLIALFQDLKHNPSPFLNKEEEVNCLRQRNLQLKQEAILLPKNVLDMHLNSRLTTKKYIKKQKSWSIYFFGYSSNDESDNDDSDRSDWLPGFS